MWWEHDGLTKLAVLYIESFGNPRKFARTARRVSGTMPVLTVLADRSARASREALFEQAGVITTRGFGELIEATALLATQPVPAGRTVAIVSNVGSAGVLAADACTDLGLSVHHPHGLTRRRLRALVPARHGHRAGRHDGPGFRPRISASAWSCSPRTTRCTPSSRSSCPPGPPVTWRPRSRHADVGVPLAAVVLTSRNPSGCCLEAESRIPAYGSPEAAVRGAGPRGRLRRLAGRTARPRARLRRRQDRGRPHAGARVPPAGPRLAGPRTDGRAAALLRDTAGRPRPGGHRSDRPGGRRPHVRPAGHARARRCGPSGPAHAADRRRRGQADPCRPRRRARRPSRTRCATCCSGSRGSPTTCPRSPTRPRPHRSPGRGGRGATRGSRWTPYEPQDPFLRKLR